MYAAWRLPSSASLSSTSPGAGWEASMNESSLRRASSWRLVVVSRTDWSMRQRPEKPAGGQEA
jgi:hypothetical protein